MTQRGYLTRHGLGLLVGLAVTAVALMPRPAEPQRALPAARALPSATVGPFVITVEQMVVERLGDRHFAFVEMHLYRPEGPVPFEQRVRIDGTPSLDGRWSRADTYWLVNNEFDYRPSLHHGSLGHVPAVDHAGEARGVFTFVAEPDAEVASSYTLTFRLPDGDVGRIGGVRPTIR